MAVTQDFDEAYLRRFARALARQLVPTATLQTVEAAFQRARSSLEAEEGEEEQDDAVTYDGLGIRFRHACRFLGCVKADCPVCKNNPNKRCPVGDDFCECYADNQVLHAKCEAEIYVEVFREGSEGAIPPELEVMVTVIDGDSYTDPHGEPHNELKELQKSDEGHPLLGSHGQGGVAVDEQGRLILKFLADGTVRLPEVFVRDKNDTFHLGGRSYNTFRLLGRAVRRTAEGVPLTIAAVSTAVSAKFTVKTQRALNDYRKSEYPHFKDELCRLKYVGAITAQRLREAKNHLGQDLPFTCIETAEQLKGLVAFAELNKAVENKLMELLNMKGKHKHKWDFLRKVLSERMVYDDVQHRVWFCDASMTRGLIYAARQAQVNLSSPLSIAQTIAGRLQAVGLECESTETLSTWRQQAKDAWELPGHSGWLLWPDPTPAGSPVKRSRDGRVSRDGQSSGRRMSETCFDSVGSGGLPGTWNLPVQFPVFDSELARLATNHNESIGALRHAPRSRMSQDHDSPPCASGGASAYELGTCGGDGLLHYATGFNSALPPLGDGLSGLYLAGPPLSGQHSLSDFAAGGPRVSGGTGSTQLSPRDMPNAAISHAQHQSLNQQLQQQLIYTEQPAASMGAHFGGGGADINSLFVLPTDAMDAPPYGTYHTQPIPGLPGLPTAWHPGNLQGGAPHTLLQVAKPPRPRRMSYQGGSGSVRDSAAAQAAQATAGAAMREQAHAAALQQQALQQQVQHAANQQHQQAQQQQQHQHADLPPVTTPFYPASQAAYVASQAVYMPRIPQLAGHATGGGLDGAHILTQQYHRLHLSATAGGDSPTTDAADGLMGLHSHSHERLPAAPLPLPPLSHAPMYHQAQQQQQQQRPSIDTLMDGENEGYETMMNLSYMERSQSPLATQDGHVIRQLTCTTAAQYGGRASRVQQLGSPRSPRSPVGQGRQQGR